MAGLVDTETLYGNLTDKQLVELEQVLYDDECRGQDTWFERDQVLWEMNRRGLLDTPR